MKEFIKQNLPAVIGAIIGLLLALCFVGLGFWKTIFVILMLICGGLIGHFWPVLENLFNRRKE